VKPAGEGGLEDRDRSLHRRRALQVAQIDASFFRENPSAPYYVRRYIPGEFNRDLSINGEAIPTRADQLKVVTVREFERAYRRLARRMATSPFVYVPTPTHPTPSHSVLVIRIDDHVLYRLPISGSDLQAALDQARVAYTVFTGRGWPRGGS